MCFALPPIERYSPVSGGAIATCVMQVVRHLAARGHQVTVLADNHESEPYDVGQFVPIRCPMQRELPLWRRGVSKWRYRMHRYDWPRQDVYVDAVAGAVRRLAPSPDVMVVENDLHSPWLLKRQFPGIRQVLWLHNEHHSRDESPNRCWAAIDHIVTNSDYIRRFTHDRYGVALDRMTVVHNGVDLDAFVPREGYNKPRRPLKVLALGRIDPNKGVDLAVDAVAALRSEGEDVEMTVVGGRWFFGDEAGSDPYFLSLKDKMNRAGATYLGHLPRKQVPAIIAQHDIACVLSRSQEPFGLVALETMACGCAVIASDRGGLPEACAGAARVVDVNRFDSVVDVLRELVQSPERLAEAKQASRQRALRADWGKAGAAMETVLLAAYHGGGYASTPPPPKEVASWA